MNKVYEYVQQNIISQLEKAIKEGTCAPWQKPWTGPGYPRNYITQKRYRGINLLLLPQGGEYITFKQILNLQNEKKYSHIYLKKGSKANMVVFWSIKEGKSCKNKSNDKPDVDGSDDTYKYMIFRYYNVYHISDVEGLTPHDKLIANEDFNTNEEAEKLINRYSQNEKISINRNLGSDKACYYPYKDSISIPDEKQFKDESEFYSTIFHEIVHSTGNEKRLNRFNHNVNQVIFGSDSYSKEELVAEIGASLLNAQFGLSNKKSEANSVAYLKSWLNAIKNNDMTFVTFASQQAQKAVDYISNIVYGEQEKAAE